MKHALVKLVNGVHISNISRMSAVDFCSLKSSVWPFVIVVPQKQQMSISCCSSSASRYYCTAVLYMKIRGNEAVGLT